MTRSYTYNIITRAILSLIMMGSTTCAWAQEPGPTYVAKIDEEHKYTTLQEAIAAANQATEATTITLLQNVTIDNVENKLNITKPMTLDMDGKTITSTIEEPFLVDGKESNTGALTITGNGTIAGPAGAAAAAHDGKAMITVKGANAKLAFLNGTMTCGGSGSDGMYGVYILESGSAVFGEQEGKTGPNITAWFAAIGENNTTAPANITIYGGTYKQDATPSDSDWWEYFCAPVYASASGTITIEGGTFNGRYAFASRYGNVEQQLNISGGTFNGSQSALLIGNVSGDGQSGTRAVKISGGEYSTPIPTEYCTEGFSPLVDENGRCTVGSSEDIAKEAEALCNGSYYKVLGNAIAASIAETTTITLLKNPAAESLTITAGANITLTIADGVTLSKPITNSGALTIASGTISSAITIAAFEATVRIATGVTSTSTIALSTELQTENVLKTSTTKESGYISYWLEKKVKAEVDLTGTHTQEQTTAAEDLATNTSISSVTGLTDNQSLIITVTGVTLNTNNDVKAATFEVKLIGANGEPITTPLTNAISFNLPILYSATATTWVNLWHDGTAITGTSTIQGSDNNKYITLSSTTFSPFSYEIIENPIAQIGETKYATVADAIEKATATEATEIKLLRDVDSETTITVTSGKNIKLTIGTHTVSGNISNEGTLTIWDGTNPEGTSGVVSGAITNTGTLTISDKANISGAVSATAGTITISGGTISNTITTSETAALTISGGTIDHAITIGGSGANTIKGGTFGEDLTTSQNTTISGGSFAATKIVKATAGTLTITGGTFDGTVAISTNPAAADGTKIAISGGMFATAPIADYCDKGYLPLKKDTWFEVKDKWDIFDDTKLSDNPHLSNGGYTVKTAKYYRNTGMVSAGNTDTKYGTICLPFEIKAQPADMKLYKATEISGNKLTITEVTDFSTAIPAGTPLIFDLSAAASTMTVTSTDTENAIAVNTTTPGTTPVTGNLLVGTYTEKVLNSTSNPVLSSNIYYLNGDTFHQAVTSLTVPAFRAYLDTTGGNGAKPMVLSIMKEGDESTSISAVEALEGVTAVYDLNGRKQNGLQRGMNILRRADGSTIKVIVK